MKNVLGVVLSKMMVGLAILISLGTLILGVGGCTGNERARKFGGTETVNLEQGERVHDVDWEDQDLWILTVQDPSTPPKTYKLKEKSNYNVISGTILIVEN